jgi:polyisoprenoid-binding protein YceI
MFSRFALRNGAIGAAILSLGLIGSGMALAALKIDNAKSNVSIVFKQLNVPIDAKFNKFTAQIDFNSAKPEASKAMIDIDIPSFDLGDPEYNKEVLKKDWFNAAQFPKATFVSSAIKPGAAGKFDVTGKLTIKGKTVDASFPLSVKKDGANQVFEGTLPIKRLTFNIGDGEWKDTGMVADEVLIKFRVVSAP